MNSILPRSSHVLPIFPKDHRRDRTKADLRREITAWKALVWAYRDECVRVASNKHQGPALRSNGRRLALAGEDWAMGDEPLGGFLEAHEDAVTIDAWLFKTACGKDFNLYAAIAVAAENNRPVPPEVFIPPRRVAPVLRDNGRPEIRYTTSGRRIAEYCLIRLVGPTEEERASIERHQASLHGFFLAVLDALQDISLSKWVIVGRGA